MTQPVPPPPLLHVVRGRPTAAELAALVAVVAARTTAAVPPPPVSDAPGWARPAALHPGPGAWRGSARLPGVRTRAAW